MMSERYKIFWLEYVLYIGKKLTSKDKLVAAYLITSPTEEGCYIYDAENIARNSGLAVKTVQKSVGRLSSLGVITFVTDVHYIIEVVVK